MSRRRALAKVQAVATVERIDADIASAQVEFAETEQRAVETGI